MCLCKVKREQLVIPYCSETTEISELNAGGYNLLRSFENMTLKNSSAILNSPTLPYVPSIQKLPPKEDNFSTKDKGRVPLFRGSTIFMS